MKGWEGWEQMEDMRLDEAFIQWINMDATQ